MKISLVGYMGSGKSAIGLELSSRLNLPFIDLDSLIEQKSQQSIADLFQKLGEIKFRKLERETLLEVLHHQNQFILATGGGTPVYYDNMKLINESSTTFYLRMNPSQLTERLALEKTKRPMIAHLDEQDLPEFIAKHLFERRNFYEMADYTIDVAQKSVQEIPNEIINQLNLQK